MKKRSKILLIVVGVILTLALTANYIAKAAFSKVITNLNEKEGFPYIIDYRKTRFDVYLGNFKVMDIKVKKKDPTTKPMFKVEVGEVKITGLNIFEIFNNTYSVNSIKIENPHFELYSKKDTSSAIAAESGIKFNLKGQLPHLVWRDLRLIRGSVHTYKIVENDTTRMVHLEGVNFDLGANNVNSVEDLISHGRFKTKAISFDVGKGSKIYIMESFVDLERRKLVLRDVSFGNEYKHERFFSNLEARALWKEITLDSLELADISLDHINNSKHIQIGQVNFFKPNVLLKSKSTLPPPEHKKEIDLQNIIPSWLSYDSLQVVEGKFEYRDYYKKNKYKFSKVENIDIALDRRGWSSDSLSQETKSHYFGVGHINISKVELQVKDYTTMKIDKLGIDFSNDKLTLNGWEIKNRLNPKRYISRQTYKEDWHHMTCESVNIDGLNLQRFLLTDTLIAEAVRVNRIALDTRTAGDINRKPSKVAPLMHNWFRKIPGYHEVKNIKISNGDLKFSMLYDKGSQTGTLNLKNINATVDKITNFNKSFVTTVKGFASYQGQNNLNLLVKIPVQDPNYRFTLQGDARSIDLASLNHFIQPMQLKFLEGRLHLLHFKYDSQDLEANATGDLVFHYDGLKLEVLKSQKKLNLKRKRAQENNSNSKVKEDNWVLSTAVNMVAKSQNMPNEKGYVVGVIDHHRYLYQGFFGHMTGCMMQGAQYCLFKSKDKNSRQKEKEERKQRKNNKWFK